MPFPTEQLSDDIHQNLALIQHHLSDTEDLKIKNLLINNKPCLILYLSSLVKTELIHSGIIEPLVNAKPDSAKQLVTSAEVNRTSDISLIGKALLDGFCILLSEDDSTACLISAALSEGRSIQEPKVEQTVIGPHEGFVESLDTNVYLIRKRLKSPKLKVTYQNIGKLTNTNVAMLYMDGRIDPNIVEECVRRLAAIETDHLYSVTNIEEWIEEHPLSPFSIDENREARSGRLLFDGG